jgi:hypothetical protein
VNSNLTAVRFRLEFNLQVGFGYRPHGNQLFSPVHAFRLSRGLILSWYWRIASIPVASLSSSTSAQRFRALANNKHQRQNTQSKFLNAVNIAKKCLGSDRLSPVL